MPIRFSTGQTAQLTVSNRPGRRFTGTVARTAESLDPNSRTMLVEVQVPNSDGALLPGMYAQVDLSSPRANPPLLLPSDSPHRSRRRHASRPGSSGPHRSLPKYPGGPGLRRSAGSSQRTATGRLGDRQSQRYRAGRPSGGTGPSAHTLKTERAVKGPSGRFLGQVALQPCRSHRIWAISERPRF